MQYRTFLIVCAPHSSQISRKEEFKTKKIKQIVYFFFVLHIPWQSAQELLPSEPAPHKMKSTLHHWTPQKLQIFKSRSRNSIPAKSIKTPPNVEHFLHPIMLVTSLLTFCLYDCKETS